MRALLQAVRRELGVATRTFFAAWVALAFAMWLYGRIVDNPQFDSATEWLASYGALYVVSLFYAFWPAVIVTTCRVAYRLIGWTAFVPLPLMVLGCVAALWLGEAWLFSLLDGVFDAMTNVGSCGAHTPSFVVGAICLGAALLSPAGVWATLKLLLAIVLLLVLGSLPGFALASAVVARAVARGLVKHAPGAS